MVETNGTNSGPSWKWFVGIVLLLAMTFGGVIWNDTDRRSLANEQRLTQLEVDLAQEKVRSTVYHQSLEQRLDRIERSLGRIEELVRQRRF